MDYDHLLGRPYLEGKTDCLGLIRGFYNPLIPTPIPNYARPTDFADESFDLFGRYVYQAGFRPINVHPSEWQVGDLILIALFSKIASHCGVIVEGGNFIHHCLGQVSVKEPYSGKWRDRTVGILRHPDLNLVQDEPVIDFTSYLPTAVQEKLR